MASINESTAKTNSATEHTEKTKEKNSKTQCPLWLNDLFAVESSMLQLDSSEINVYIYFSGLAGFTLSVPRLSKLCASELRLSKL